MIIDELFFCDFDFYRFLISIDINRRIKSINIDISIDFWYRLLSINYVWITEAYSKLRLRGGRLQEGIQAKWRTVLRTVVVFTNMRVVALLLYHNYWRKWGRLFEGALLCHYGLGGGTLFVGEGLLEGMRYAEMFP